MKVHLTAKAISFATFMNSLLRNCNSVSSYVLKIIFHDYLFISFEEVKRLLANLFF